MILAVIVWICSLTVSQCTVIKTINNECTQAKTFLHAINITISNCTFQHFNTCVGAIFVMSDGFLKVQQCQFLSNHVGRTVSACYSGYTALFINSDVTFANPNGI